MFSGQFTDGAGRGALTADLRHRHGIRSPRRHTRVLLKACGGTKTNLSQLQVLEVARCACTAGNQLRGQFGIFIMSAQTELESYADLAEHCRWEAERTLDREVANSLRALAGRYRRMSERSPRQADRSSFQRRERTGAR